MATLAALSEYLLYLKMRMIFISFTLEIPIRTMATAVSTGPKPLLANNLREAAQLLRSQPSHYVIASLVGRRLIITPRDLVTVPRLKDVNVGDILQLNAIEELGSREYTLRGSPFIPEEVVSVTATVVEHTKGLMERIVKFKRRKGYKKTFRHKQTYTRLRVNDIQIAKP
jgi:large subunit ribosomal protein L21